ncbi:hypothetical protein KP806_13925 [Paenibacillus sp. N4]|uniref:hypothetical protein n=1 Tax=Paenibacillus vietnamensis TaxID=2590547 RepID=UPI001CD13253|nr:hypothetical protein [Paenibacillus vietnamensis]MCA0756149.1 hypothetical protein [Paenibacillus vietnamensis]
MLAVLLPKLQQKPAMRSVLNAQPVHLQQNRRQAAQNPQMSSFLLLKLQRSE